MTDTTNNNIAVLPATMSSIEEQFHVILREVADFNAIYETLQEKLKAREFALEQKISAGGQQLSNQLIEIKRLLDTFANFTTEEGAARSRMSIKQAKDEAQAGLHALKSTCDDIRKAVEDVETRLENTVTQTLTQVTEIAQNFPAGEFKQVTQQSCNEIKTTATGAIKQLTSYINLFHRKNLMMAFVLTLLMAFILGLYLNGEWPWEIHQEVLKERNAGRALLTAWPKLSPSEQQAIIAASNRNPIV